MIISSWHKPRPRSDRPEPENSNPKEPIKRLPARLLDYRYNLQVTNGNYLIDEHGTLWNIVGATATKVNFYGDD